MSLFAPKSNSETSEPSLVSSLPAVVDAPVNRVEAPALPSRLPAPVLSWKETAYARRRFKNPLGLQSRLLLAFFAVMAASLGVVCLLYSQRVQERLSGSLQDQVTSIAQALAQATLSDYRMRDLRRVGDIGKRLVNGSEIMLVSFRDQYGTAVVTTTRGNVPFDASKLEFNPAALTKVQPDTDPKLGELYRVTVPVLGTSGQRGQNGILGYVTVAISRKSESEMQVFLASSVFVVACGMMTVAMPLAWLLLRSMFRPVNELVAATKKIINGELDTFVKVDGEDAVAQLARSFNELVNWLKQHRAQIDAANGMLEEANHQLERKIEQRTIQLESANGRLSSEIAEKEDFLRAVSHDLNAPLRNIGGTVAMLVLKHKAQITPEMQEKFDRIKRNVEIETDLINELLELSRIKTRRATMELVETEAMIWDLRGLFDNDLKSKGIEIVLESSLPNLWAEKSRVRQIFQNLIDNAIKYMGEKPLKQIRVGCRARVTEAEFYVSDTGSGIDPQDIKKVFFVFRRGRSEETQKVAGKGVGLASVKSIIENYSGKIWVESELNIGTTFFFTINSKHVPSVSGQSIEELKRIQNSRHDEENEQEKLAA